MHAVNRRQFFETSLATAGAVVLGSRAGFAAVTPGVEIKAIPSISGEERIAQPDIWVLEMNFKPVRMITVELPDGQTGNSARHLIWYLVYRVVRRPPTDAAGKSNQSFER